jgi:FixJ family two-component response regulator
MANEAFTFLQKPILKKDLLAALEAAITQHISNTILKAPAKAANNAILTLTDKEKKIAIMVGEGLRPKQSLKNYISAFAP